MPWYGATFVPKPCNTKTKLVEVEYPWQLEREVNKFIKEGDGRGVKRPIILKDIKYSQARSTFGGDSYSALIIYEEDRNP